MRLLKRLYERVWRPTAGRPWTYQLRDFSRHHPFRFWLVFVVTAVILFVGQIQLVIWFGWWAAPFVAFADFMSFVAAHLIWGSGPFTRPVSDFRRNDDSGLSDDQAVLSDRAVVGDMGQIVEFCPPADSRDAVHRSVDRRIHSDFDVVFNDDLAELGNLFMAAVDRNKPYPSPPTTEPA